MTAEPSTSTKDEELVTLRARVSELEEELAEQTRTTLAVVAEAQEKLYWLERWHVDLDAVMRKPGALRTLELLRGARLGLWRARRLKRRILS